MMYLAVLRVKNRSDWVMKLLLVIAVLVLTGCGTQSARNPVTRGAAESEAEPRAALTPVDFARTHNANRSFGAAEEAWRRVLAEREDPEALVRLAVDVSNMGRTREGQVLIERASKLAETTVGQRLPVLIALARAQIAILDATASDNGSAWREASVLLTASFRSVQSEMRRRNIDPLSSNDNVETVEADIAPSALRLADLELHRLSALVALRQNEVSSARQWISDGIARLERLGAGVRTSRHAAFAILNAELLGRSTVAAEREASVAQAERSADLSRAAAGPTGSGAALGLLATGRAIAIAAEYETDRAIAIARRQRAMAYFREGFSRLDNQEERPKTIAANLAVAVLDNMGAILPGLKGEEREAFLKEMLSVAQRVPVGAAARAAELAAARRLVDDPNAGALVRQWQDTLRKRDDTQARILDLYASGNLEQAKLVALREERTAADNEATAARADLEKRFPDVVALLSPKPPTVADIQRVLLPDESVILILSGRRGGWTFAVQKNSIETQQVLLERLEIIEQVKTLRNAFAPADGRLRNFDLAGAHDLYKELLGDLTEAMEPGRRLIFITSGALSAYPPALFITKPERGTDYSRASWLIREHPVLSLPSTASLIAFRNAQKTIAPKMLLAVGDPVLTGPKGSGTSHVADSCDPDGNVPPEMISALEPLPDTAAEVRAVSAALGGTQGDLLLGRQATSANFKSRDLSSYRVLYFATHGILPGELKCRTKPGLIFTPTGTNSGLMDTNEISELQLNADLVVMSACNTAGAAELGGEALSGLAEAFIFAGARALIASHWQVPSQETAFMMKSMFARGLPPDLAAALAKAQLEIAANPQSAHPFYWAAFTLIGASASVAGGA
jgi:CHAT domain-containing protein